jgi:hypothetical protein
MYNFLFFRVNFNFLIFIFLPFPLQTFELLNSIKKHVNVGEYIAQVKQNPTDKLIIDCPDKIPKVFTETGDNLFSIEPSPSSPKL